MKQKDFLNILVKARKKRKLTQEATCALMGVSDANVVSNWETGKHMPGLETVRDLARVYQEPRVLWAYLELKECSDLLPFAIRDKELLETDDLIKMGLRAQKEYNDVAKVMPKLISILYDGVIHPHEKEIYESVMQEVEEMAEVFAPLVIINKQNKKALQDGNLERACV